MSNNPISVLVREGIAMVRIDHPPVNALDWRTRSALLEAVVAADQQPHVQAILIHGEGRFFVAGADVREFDAEPRTPLLNDVLLRIEGCTKPVVAGIHGAALGGGLELALACHYRCAMPDTTLGFPEIKLGLLPGAGGTQRLPRLVGPAVTLELMLGGQSIPVARAVTLGVIDHLLDREHLLEGAFQYTRQLVREGSAVRRLCDRAGWPVEVSSGLFSEARTRIARDYPDVPAAGYIVECVEASLSQPFAYGLALARTRFEACRVSTASRALRHLFFAERGRGDQVQARDTAGVQRVAVIGAGTMGSGIAISLATAGYDTVLIDTQAAVLEAGIKRIGTTLQAAAAKGRLTAEAAAAAAARVRAARELDSAADAHLVIEAVFESLAVKQEVFGALDRVCAADAVLATNTSTLNIDAIASVTRHPKRVCGMHFFSPAHVMRLVEIVRGAATAPDVLASVGAVVRRLGKLGIVVGNCFGFVGNRMLYAFGRENQLMLLEGAGPGEIDAALRAFGMAMGPNAVGDLAGLDVGYRVRRERADLPDDPRYYRVADLLVEAGRPGQKSGRGAFRYDAGSRTPLPDPEVDVLIESEARRLGIVRRHLDPTEITGRCIYALINEGARLLEEGIAQSAADIDAIWCNGYGFPRTKGGPMFYADTLGAPRLLAGIEDFARQFGARYWQPAMLLRQLAERNSSFEKWDERRRAEVPTISS